MPGSFPSQLGPGTLRGTTPTQTLPELLNAILMALNTKDAGYYPRTEFVNGQVWFPDPTLTSDTPTHPVLRPDFRIVVIPGALPNAAGMLTVAHGLDVTAGYSFTRIYGTANNPMTAFLPMPYPSSVAADIIELAVDATNVYIVVGKDMSAFTKNYVVLEYIKT
jgi:hypothetical protein